MNKKSSPQGQMLAGYGQLVNPTQFREGQNVTLLCQEGKVRLSGTIVDCANTENGPHFFLLQPAAPNTNTPKRIPCIFYGSSHATESKLAVNVNKKILTVTAVRF